MREVTAMVDLAKELDDEEEAGERPKKKKKSPVLKIILIIFGILILGAAVAGATVYFTKGKSSSGDAASQEAAKDAAAVNKDSQAIYYAIDPAFVVNFADKNQMRFLQVTMEVMAYDQSAIDAVKQHLPVIRNNLVMLLSSQDAKTLFSLEGKQHLRQECLQEIQKVLMERTGRKGVEDVYFTSFVMQ